MDKVVESSAQPTPVSAAQLCPDDVLNLIFEHADLRLPDIAVAALVCRRWLDSARARLYTEINFITSRDGATGALVTALRSNPVLCTYARRLQLVHLDPCAEYPMLYDWIRLLPTNNVLHLTINHHLQDPAFGELMLSMPLFSSVRSLSLHGCFTPCLWSSVDAVPIVVKAVDLRVNLSPDCNRFFRLQLPSLKKLSINADKPCPSIALLLSLTHATIEDLRLVITGGFDSWDDNLIRALSLMTSLRRLHIHAKPGRPLPFIDEVIPRFIFLKYLQCSYGCYGASVFAALPPTLETLKLQSILQSDASGERPRILLARGSVLALDRVRRGDLALKNLTIFRHTDESDLQEITDAFDSAGVVFKSSSCDEARRVVYFVTRK